MLPLTTQLVNTPQIASIMPSAALGQAGQTSGALSSLGTLLNPVSLFGATNISANIAPTTAFTKSPAVAGGLNAGGGLTQAFGGLGQMLGLMANSMLNPRPAGGAAGNAPSINVPGNINTTADPNQRALLDQSLSKISQDPEGSALLQQALANGYTIEVGDPNIPGLFDQNGAHDASICQSCQAALDTGGQINGVTIPNQKKIIINPNAPEFDKTLVHELVHASTEGDGNSRQEEGLADVVGYHVSSRINGTLLPGSDAQIFNNKIQNYPELQATNGITNSLANLGIL